MVQEKEIDKILKSLINELKNNHGCHTIILYGSHARGDATEKSDFDILGIKDKGEFYRIGRDCCGVFLDAFIYSVGNLPASSDLLRVHSGKILLDENGIGERLLKTINEEFEKPVQKLPDWEKELRKTWVKKMYERSLVGDIEGNHRRHWLLFDLLENWFNLNGIRFEGSKKAFEFLKSEKPELYLLFEKALKPGAQDSEILALIKIFI